MNKYVCIHGHFYQPPRENAWLEEVEIQESAYPYHDWNERITREGYAPNTASRILGPERKIIDISNNYSKTSFNIGPTLLSWMERKAPDVYQAILDADKKSQTFFNGHGSAIAQVYNHMIMPLANARDKRTQVYWGIRDFQQRFNRYPEGMWLPETAVDLMTLDVLAEFDIKFTILSPYQASRVRKIGDEEWTDVKAGKVDPKRPYRCHLPSGKTIDLFFYDGPIAQDVGFGDLLYNGEHFANRLLGVFSDNDDPELSHIATDGETYGHHRRHGDMALSYCLHHIEQNDRAKLMIYADYLEKYPSEYEVEIIENSSWSCVHGVERWKSNCGCHTGMNGHWSQEWRTPLRKAMNWLREELIPVYENETITLLTDPWQARNDYIEVILNRSDETMNTFIEKQATKTLSSEEKIRVIKCLELQRNAMLMFTSCGWFFDEISGIETTQVMQYAARAIQLAEDITDRSFEPEYMDLLEKAQSNLTEFKNGKTIYQMFIKPAQLDLIRVGAHYAVSSLFEDYPQDSDIYCYTAVSEDYEKLRAGRINLAIGRARVRSNITWQNSDISFAVLYLGGHIINGGIREFMGNEAYDKMKAETRNSFKKSDIPAVIRFLDTHFGDHNYTLWHLFKDERKKVFDQILESSMEDIQVFFRQIFENDYTTIQAMREMQLSLPKALATPVEFVLNTDLQNILESESIDLTQLKNLVAEFKKMNVTVEKSIQSLRASNRITKMMKKLGEKSDDADLIRNIEDILAVLQPLDLDIDLWETQNIYFILGKKHFGNMKKKAKQGDKKAKNWVDHFTNLGAQLRVKVD